MRLDTHHSYANHKANGEKMCLQLGKNIQIKLNFLIEHSILCRWYKEGNIREIHSTSARLGCDMLGRLSICCVGTC